MEKHLFALQVSHLLGEAFSREWIYEQIEIPKKESMGDLSFPCFSLAKTLRKNPASIAVDLASHIDHEIFSEVKATGGYVNAFLNQSFITSHTLKQVLTAGRRYGEHDIGKGKTVVLDLSSPNIAKPFSMGHLRSTVIGQAISHLAEKCGYKTVKINYIGDYGTQFGKLLAAYHKWGDPEKIQKDPIKELTKIYVQFHEASKQDPGLIEEGREWFKKLEENDETALELWRWFKDASLKEFDKIYELLNISFDLVRGEAYYNDKMEKTITEIMKKGILEESEGAQVVRLDEEGLPPCLIRKSNGTTTYATRDITSAIDRYDSFAFDESLYVVGHEQTLHFQQIKHVLQKMGYSWADHIHHVPFGMMLKEGKKMSTRQGKTILLEEVLQEAIDHAKQNIELKNPDLPDKQKVAKQVGVGAVIFHDLKHDRKNDVEFSLEQMLTFEGNTAPYLQYTYARATSILRRAQFDPDQATDQLEDSHAWTAIKLIRRFPEVIEDAYQNYDPSRVARYLLDLAKSFNQYYAATKIIGNSQEQAHLTFIYTLTTVLQEGLSLLGIETPDEM
ncbi:arginine--tRNA ligase [Halobacillus fulvus]|nr:arginine--tRNA ligase [Halobacillus fulvus]